MRQLILVGIGGCLGAMARYTIGGLASQAAPGARFPVGTFVVNASGCLAAGLLAGLAGRKGWFGPDLRLFLFTGVLGGYTTFSAFGLETVQMLQRQQAGLAAAYVCASVFFSMLALWVGMKLVS